MQHQLSSWINKYYQHLNQHHHHQFQLTTTTTIIINTYSLLVLIQQHMNNNNYHHYQQIKNNIIIDNSWQQATISSSSKINNNKNNIAVNFIQQLKFTNTWHHQPFSSINLQELMSQSKFKIKEILPNRRYSDEERNHGGITIGEKRRVVEIVQSRRNNNCVVTMMAKDV